MTDSFDPNVFLQASFTDPSETEVIPCPVGEYPAVAESVKPRLWESEKNGGSAGVNFDVFWSIEDDGVKQTCKKDKVLVRQSFMFTFLPGTQEIDKEKAQGDVRFGRFRAALGLNDGEFSWLMVPGRMAKVRVGHETVKGIIYANVDAATAL